MTTQNITPEKAAYIISMMQKYNLTLRCFSDIIKTTHRYSDKEAARLTQKGIDFQVFEGVITREQIPRERFERYKRPSTRYANGYVIEKFITYQKPDTFHQEKGVWGCNVAVSFPQEWDKENTFYGKTPEAAIEQAVAHIENQKKKREERHKEAGLID